MSGVSGSNISVGTGGGGSASGGASGSDSEKTSPGGASKSDGVNGLGAIRAIPAPVDGPGDEPIGGASGSGGSNDSARGDDRPAGGASGSNDRAADGDA